MCWGVRMYESDCRKACGLESAEQRRCLQPTGVSFFVATPRWCRCPASPLEIFGWFWALPMDLLSSLGDLWLVRASECSQSTKAHFIDTALCELRVVLSSQHYIILLRRGVVYPQVHRSNAIVQAGSKCECFVVVFLPRLSVQDCECFAVFS
jgi:hypothetical protein